MSVVSAEAMCTKIVFLQAKREHNRVRFLTPDEEKKLRDAIRSKPEWAEHEPELDLALHTGLPRRSMYIDLLWENVDLKARIAIIPETKNDDQVVVPLNDVAMSALAVFRARGDGHGCVVRNAAGKTLTVNALGSRMRFEPLASRTSAGTIADTPTQAASDRQEHLSEISRNYSGTEVLQ